MNGEIFGDNRPRPPKAWGNSGGSWHHVIPFAFLRDLWNRLIELHIGTQIPEARTALWQYLMLCDPALLHLDQLVDRMRAENKTQKRASHVVLLELTNLEWQPLQIAAVQPAWNCVGGPSARSDEPGDFELDRFFNGPGPADRLRMRAIESLFRSLRAFPLAGADPGPGDWSALIYAIKSARHELNGLGPIPYTPDMWIEGPGGGSWRKRHP